MKEFTKSDFELAGANFGEKVAKNIYNKYHATAFELAALLREVDSTEGLIQADADCIIEEIWSISPKYKEMIKNICSALKNRIVKDFPIIEDDFNFEDDFADEYDDSPANIYNMAFWNSFNDTLNRLQLH